MYHTAIHSKSKYIVRIFQEKMIEIRKTDPLLAKILPPACPAEGVTYVPSQYALAFTHGGKHYVFHNLTKQCIEGELPSSCRAGEGCADLIKARFLVPEGKDECATYNQISSLVRAYSKKKDTRGFLILPTLGCNARCVYCYEEGMKPVTMTPETVEQVIRFITEQNDSGRVSLGWFGGEPLLGEKTIDRICEGMREAGIEYTSRMTSNGSLITPEIIRKMTGDWKLGKIQISMDGAREDYIRRKNYYAGHDYYSKVMEAVSAMSEAGIAVNIRCNVDEENWEGMPRFFDDLRTGVSNKDRVSVYFAPLNTVRLGNNDVAIWEKIRDSRQLIEEAGFRCQPFLRLNLRFRACRCMADGGSVVITPEGSLYPCEHCPEEGRYGDIWQGAADADARKEFCRVDRTREKCRSCPFLPDCTSFAACPVEDHDCREVFERLVADDLKRLAETKESIHTDEEMPVC